MLRAHGATRDEPDDIELENATESEDEDDLRLAVTVGPEVNPEVYKDVGPMLFRGFVGMGAEINGVPFLLKSLNHHEHEQLQMLASSLDTGRALQRYYALFIAYGIAAVDCCNVLKDRERWIPELADMFSQLPEGPRRKVIRSLSELNRRANRAAILTEAYAMEAQSRLRWAQYKGADLTSTAVTGFEGTQVLGLNWAQLGWLALNYFEDLREQAEREWENAKFIASAFAGKGMSRVYSQDRARRRSEREQRLERKDRLLRCALLGESPDGAQGRGVPVQVARSVEELAHQLERDLKGEKDWHDHVIEDYERQARAQYQQRMLRARELREGFVERHGEKSMLAETRMHGLTPEQVHVRIGERRNAEFSEYPELHDPKRGEFMNKWHGADAPHVDAMPTASDGVGPLSSKRGGV